MWLFTPSGFLSAVADLQVEGNTLVRARVRGDLDAFCAATGAPDPTETPNRDYRFRTSVPRATFAAYVAGQAEAIDYPNFKAEVAELQGEERAERYAEIWSAMYRLQEDENGA